MGRDFLFVKEGTKNIKVNINEIWYVSSHKNYLEIHLEKKKYRIRSKLSDFALLLPHSFFIRVHRRYLVNMYMISNHSATQITIGKAEIPISQTYRKDFIDKTY
ncbi:LytR/AlgR family response regulator transcription factor [Ulvibacterium sp.]|uniref:LytR/AlgR family response regulator transcription factor n=1 Tax=Ulvibacterium sp. TaxID=2665914 RepID=UPI003BAAF696